MQSCLALLVLPLGVSAVLEEAPQHGQVPGLGSDVDRGAAIAPGQVRVSTRLEQNLKIGYIQKTQTQTEYKAYIRFLGFVLIRVVVI